MNINTSVGQLQDQITEIVGIKTGLVVSRRELVFLFERDLSDGDEDWYYSPDRWLREPDDIWVRLRAEELESLAVRLMWLCGALPTPLTPNLLMFRFARTNPSLSSALPFDEDEEAFPLPVTPVLRLQWAVGDWERTGTAPINFRLLLEDVQKRSMLRIMSCP